MSGGRFVRILPEASIHSKGWRLRLESTDRDWPAVLACEKTLPERVANPDANLIEPADCIYLTEEDAVWLHATLVELLSAAGTNKAMEVGDRPGPLFEDGV
jgi:hypothetical protein